MFKVNNIDTRTKTLTNASIAILRMYLFAELALLKTAVGKNF